MLRKLLNQFETVSLNELNVRAPLLNRKDMKFVFSCNQLEQVLQDCEDKYYVLTINDNTIFNYRTWYYDTAGLLFYHQHHTGKTNRCKIRRRLYVNSNQSFIEVKHRTNKDKTIKYRYESGSLDDAQLFIRQYSGYDSAGLTEAIEINYSRITLLHKTKPEKVTFDINLSYKQNKCISGFNNIVIAEVKTERCATTFFIKIMKKNSIRQNSFSKYCLGLISINSQIKHNNFKQLYNKILKINRHGIFF